MICRRGQINISPFRGRTGFPLNPILPSTHRCVYKKKPDDRFQLSSRVLLSESDVVRVKRGPIPNVIFYTQCACSRYYARCRTTGETKTKSRYEQQLSFLQGATDDTLSVQCGVPLFRSLRDIEIDDRNRFRIDINWKIDEFQLFSMGWWCT